MLEFGTVFVRRRFVEGPIRGRFGLNTSQSQNPTESSKSNYAGTGF